MALEALAERVRQRDQRHRQDRGGEHDVGDQDREVDDPNRPLALERTRADVRVVDHVAHQEERRRRERGQHEPPVRLDAAAADHHVSADEQDRRSRVQRGVDSGQSGIIAMLSAEC